MEGSVIASLTIARSELENALEEARKIEGGSLGNNNYPMIFGLIHDVKKSAENLNASYERLSRILSQGAYKFEYRVGSQLVEDAIDPEDVVYGVREAEAKIGFYSEKLLRGGMTYIAQYILRPDGSWDLNCISTIYGYLFGSIAQEWFEVMKGGYDDSSTKKGMVHTIALMIEDQAGENFWYIQRKSEERVREEMEVMENQIANNLQGDRGRQAVILAATLEVYMRYHGMGMK